MPEDNGDPTPVYEAPSDYNGREATALFVSSDAEVVIKTRWWLQRRVSCPKPLCREMLWRSLEKANMSREGQERIAVGRVINY